MVLGRSSQGEVEAPRDHQGFPYGSIEPDVVCVSAGLERVNARAPTGDPRRPDLVRDRRDRHLLPPICLTRWVGDQGLPPPR